MDVGVLGQRRFGIPRQGDEDGAHALDLRHDGHQLVGATGVGQCDEHVLRRDHAQIAVTGLGRVHEEGRRAGGGQRGGDLAGDVPGLAHAADDDAPLAGQHLATGTAETLVQRIAQVLHGIGLDGQHLAGAVEQGVVVDLGGMQGSHARTGK